MISATGRMPEHRGADREADDRLLGHRRVAHALGPELVDEAARHAVDAAAGAPARDVLAEQEDARVAGHLLAQRLVERRGVGEDAGSTAAATGRHGVRRRCR